METRARVICHMFITIDGNAVSELMWGERFEYAVEEYNRIMLADGEAFGAGRESMQTDLTVDLSKYANIPASYTDIATTPDENPFMFVIDRYGKLRWDSNIYVEGGILRNRIFEVLTEKVAPEVLAYYNELKIPYMFAGKEDFEPETFLEKISKLYGVKTFVLSGGPIINGIFLKNNLVDEISLVVAPGVDGNENCKPFLITEGLSEDARCFHLKEAKVLEGDLLHVRYTK